MLEEDRDNKTNPESAGLPSPTVERNLLLDVVRNPFHVPRILSATILSYPCPVIIEIHSFSKNNFWSCRMVLLAIPVNVAAIGMTCVIGLIVLAYYSSIKCDPLANKDIANPNMAR